MVDELFTETSGSLAQKCNCLPETVRHYANEAKIESLRLPNGVRLFKPSAAVRVRELHAEGLARRGRHRRTA